MALTGEFLASDLTIEYQDGANYYALTTYVNEDEFSRTVGEAETTAHGTTARTFIPGLKEYEYSFTLMHNNQPPIADRPQTRLRALLEDRLVRLWRIRPNGSGTGRPEITFEAFVSEMVDDLANDDQPVSSSVTLRITGPVTYSTQA